MTRAGFVFVVVFPYLWIICENNAFIAREWPLANFLAAILDSERFRTPKRHCQRMPPMEAAIFFVSGRRKLVCGLSFRRRVDPRNVTFRCENIALRPVLSDLSMVNYEKEWPCARLGVPATMFRNLPTFHRIGRQFFDNIDLQLRK